MEEKYLKITKIENRYTERNIPYKLITFEEVIVSGNSEVSTNVFAKKCIWTTRTNVNVVDRETGNNYSETWSGDLLFNSAEIGGFIQGKIVVFNTTPYKVDGQIFEQVSLCLIS